MGVIVSKGCSKLRCDHIGCKTESINVFWNNSGQAVVKEAMQTRGWQCLMNGKTYCPNHAYGKGRDQKTNVTEGQPRQRLVGKFLVGRKKTLDGKPVTMICGICFGEDFVGSDNHEGMIAELFLGEHRMVSEKALEDMSPEDFLENMDEINWK